MLNRIVAAQEPIAIGCDRACQSLGGGHGARKAK